LYDPQDRLEVSNFIRTLWVNPDVNVTEISRDLLDRSLSLFQSRLDKEWTFTDCISFTVMKENGITEALTGDHHFTQAGFKILLT
jgi:predicted nucleic acid-binding protein